MVPDRIGEVRNIAQNTVRSITHLVDLIGGNANDCGSTSSNTRTKLSTQTLTPNETSGLNKHTCSPSQGIHNRGTAMPTASSITLNRARSNLTYPYPRTRPQQDQNIASGSAFEELQRRFPTAFRRSSSRTRARSNGAGTPHASMVVTRDIVVVENREQRIPSKTEKAHLEGSGRVITGLDINRGWSDVQLKKELSANFPTECKDV